MHGLLADENFQGHMPRLGQALRSLDLSDLLAEEAIRFESFRDHGLASGLDDRSLWNYCQDEGFVLLTYDKNNDGPNSLQATMEDSWIVGRLPVITVSNQNQFARDGAYAVRVASSIAEILFGGREGEVLDWPRIFVPA